MQINKERLKLLWDNCDEILNDNLENEIITRFNWLDGKIDEFLQINIEIKDENNVEINNKNITRNTQSFGPIHDEDFLTDTGRGCLNNLNEILEKSNKQFDQINTTIWNILTGTLENGWSRKDSLRIFSNGSNDSIHTLRSGVNALDYYFASNNYFFQFIRFLQKVQENPDIGYNEIIGDDDGQIPLVLTYDEEIKNHYREKINTRFVLKFLWMWANKEKIITIPSLQLMRDFCDSELCKEILNNNIQVPREIIIKDYDEFVKNWQTISDDVLKTLGIDKSNKDDVQKVSKLLSYVLNSYDTKNIIELISSGSKAVILYGAPGTGKTYEAKKVVAAMLGLEQKIEDIEQNKKIKTDEAMEEALKEVQFDASNDKGSWTLVQFHPSYSYEDFIGGIKPKVNAQKGVFYEIESGQFKKFCDEAGKKENEGKNFIFIIDEINRSNLSSVFGELLYCLEYRGDEISIPHFQEKFSIPKNVYVIGTMNDVDKSLQIFDRALRRRFYFYNPSLPLCIHFFL